MDVSILREKICNLTLFDDELMTLAFHNQCELTQILLDAICPECEFKVTQVTAQQALYNIMGRSLKLDILAHDVYGRTVNIEVQQLPQGAAPVRARFHASLLDVHLLNKGKVLKICQRFISFLSPKPMFWAVVCPCIQSLAGLTKRRTILTTGQYLSMLMAKS